MPPLPEPTAQAAIVQSYDGRTAVVDHDGSCVLILRRTYYPGWFYQIDGGPHTPVLKVEGGLQGIRLVGSGSNQVVVSYQPTGLAQATTVSLTAITAAVCVLGITALSASMRSAQAG